MLNFNSAQERGFRLLDACELELISGGHINGGGNPMLLGLNGGGSTGSVCPIDEWWNPNFLTDDFGNVEDLPGGGAGIYTQYWTNGSTWCFYDAGNNLLGEYREDPNGSFQVSFTGTDADAEVNFSVAGTGAGGSANDSSSTTITIKLKKVG
jgi:hypothetical protein